MATLDSHFDRFLQERTYLKNVSPKTRVWYETGWETFLRTQVPNFGTTAIDSPQAITRQHLQAFVIALRDRGVRPVTVNTWPALADVAVPSADVTTGVVVRASASSQSGRLAP
jgi:hypothetical protein